MPAILTSIIFLAIGMVLVGATPVPPSPLRLATTFSRIANELDHIGLGDCSLVNVGLPLNNTNPQLPQPSSHLSLKYVALGRGTQNYSCPSSTDSFHSRNSTVPVATGAVATLFDASCIASTSLTLLNELPAIIQSTPLGSLTFVAEMLSRTTDSSDPILGEHYFDASGDPFFDLRLSGSDDWIIAKKDASVDAPKRASRSSGNGGSKDVAWLELGCKEGHGIKEVYRVMTYGGSSPTTCAGQNDAILVDYAAEYWFYGS
ncbi:hypothetical protein N7462_007485 [Penicillium macrosclerotiorum]|uniref:uncharacterized protein n=1 Tax=Penicillium macrosclerotiorum TaxID=303699 RepID=UPI002547055E|nr:uncharacterized protein N7462_007485 [Penicillium macrosclerotiorum]KAJ5679241.1 hypothetical protein N7462_007485 [Penicillium macrosclerotiorum]